MDLIGPQVTWWLYFGEGLERIVSYSFHHFSPIIIVYL